MKNGHLEILSALAGATGGATQAKKEGRGLKDIILRLITGSVIGFGIVGALEEYADVENAKILIPLAFIGGVLSDEIIKYLEKGLKVVFDFASSWLKSKVEDKKIDQPPLDQKGMEVNENED